LTIVGEKLRNALTAGAPCRSARRGFTKRMKTKAALTPVEKKLRDHALALPEAVEDFPWGSRAFKVGGKAFVVMSNTDGVISIGTKLPDSHRAALKQPFASPTHYGLGRHGWVTCAFPEDAKVPVPLLIGYIDESYRAVAPKRLTSPRGASAKKKKPTK
jgi:predicted DNA-binding protein (MmcQ/YjbR family)